MLLLALHALLSLVATCTDIKADMYNWALTEGGRQCAGASRRVVVSAQRALLLRMQPAQTQR